MMRDHERHLLRQAKARLQSGDRAGALAILRAVIDSPCHAPSRPDADQTEFRLWEWVEMECPRLGWRGLVVRCLDTRAAKWPSGKRKGRPKRHECIGCELGAEMAERFADFVPRPSSQPPEVLPTSQRMAKRARALVSLGMDDVVHVDPLREAATLSPDDSTDWRA